jgi:AsmA-like C-terminal region
LNRQNAQKTIAIALLLAGGALWGSLQLVPRFVDKEALRISIEKGLNDATGVRFHIHELSLKPTLFHQIQVNLNTNTITDEHGHPLGDIRNISIEIRYLPLLITRVPEIAKIHLNHVNIPIRDYSLFRALRLQQVKPEDNGFLKPAELHDTELLLTHYRIEDFKPELTARTLIAGTRRVKLEGPNLSVRHLESSHPIVLLGKGRLSFKGQPPNSSHIISPHQSLLITKPAQHIEPAEKTLWHGNYNFQAELDPASFQENHAMSAGDLGLLLLSFKGHKLEIKTEYRRQSGHRGEGKLQSRTLSLPHAQAIALQLANMFSITPPLPLRQARLTGRIIADNQFKLDFDKKPQPFESLSGDLRLRDVGVYANGDIGIPRIQRANGRLILEGDAIHTADKLRFQLGNLPLFLHGRYRLSDGDADAFLEGWGLHIDSLKSFAKEAGVKQDAFQGRKVAGAVDFTAHLQGTTKQPRYTGNIKLKDAAFEDAKLGARVDHINGHLNVAGEGFETPKLRYDGRVIIAKGHLSGSGTPQSPMKWTIPSVDGDVAFHGQWVVKPGATPPLPNATGVIRFRDGQAQIPNSKVSATGIQGQIHLKNDTISLQGARALLANQLIQAQGQSDIQFKRYQARVWGQRLSLPAIFQAISANLPPAQAHQLSRLNVENGLANLDVTASTGMRLNGKLDLSGLSVRTLPYTQRLKTPHLLLTFNDKNATLAPATLYYGPVITDSSGHRGQLAVKASGLFTLPAAGRQANYNVKLASQNVPMAFLRDLQPTVQALTGASLPEIWNTAGMIGFDAALSNRSTHVVANFQNAGLSWQGADFPVSELNGGFSLDWAASGKPHIATRDLTLVYGNSPIHLDARHDQQLALLTEGTLSALTVNHFLVSHQSEATPYRDIPFRIQANGNLGALASTLNQPTANKLVPPPGSELAVSLYLDLNHTLKGVSAGSSPPIPFLPNPAANSSAAEPPMTLGERLNRQNNNNQVSLISRLNPVRITKGFISRTNRIVESGVTNFVQAIPGRKSPWEENLQETQPASAAAQAKPVAIEQKSTTVSLSQAEEAMQMQASIDDSDNAYLDIGLLWKKGDLFLDKGILHLFNAGNVLASGTGQNVLHPDQSTLQAHIWTPTPLALKELADATGDIGLFREAKGELHTDLQWGSQPGMYPALTGWLTTDNVKLPEVELGKLTSRIDFSGQGAVAQVDALEIPGIKTKAHTRTENIFESPVTLEDVDIQASLLDVAGISDYNNRIIKPVIIDRLVHNYLRPWQLGDPYIPIQFRNGSLRGDELIYQNILLNNLQSQLSVYANGFFEMSNTRLEAAGGTASGYLSMSPNDNSFTTLELNVANVKANALTKALLNVTNQIFGELSGTVRFTTFGATDMDMQRNANGTVSMRVENGRLPAIAKVETLLTTANLVRGGVLGFNLNNLLRTLTIYDTNYFAELSGDLLINNQVLYTRNLISDGVNLDLLMRGNLRMDSGDADMVINGRMSQNVAGRLGFLGQLSLGKLLRLVPALGTMGKKQAGLFGYLPGIGYVPGFGGPASATNRFQVRLKGAPDSPSAIRDFHWVHTSYGSGNRRK